MKKTLLKMKKINLLVFLLINSILFSQSVATFYKNKDFYGSGISLPVGNYNCNDLINKGIGNNQLSSIKVKPGYQVTVFVDADFEGLAQSINGYNVPDLNRYYVNDKISSIRIRKIPAKGVTLYADCDYKGKTYSLPEGYYGGNVLADLGFPIKTLSSLKVSTGYKVKLFDGFHFTGSNITVSANDKCLVNNNFNDKTISVVVSPSCSCSKNSSEEIYPSDNIISDTQFEIYPNPVVDFINVTHSKDIEKLELFSFSGRKEDVKVIKSPEEGKSKIDVTALKNGLYILVGTTRNGESLSKKIKVQR
ncbi:T9SS type A sorting domain-containing protein [Chryseobacterium profundimaris]|uniref:Por secretion system C-terminal sorting domain-containing protein n=1 Tax=Chryseobacterium profundimaris TaxID=1387275 RepID=A0ABY1NAY1_9FLAO|nr:T9SS type A sorting domain-containing protein [Chryseobacterium profundimaris]SMP05266.1 Por secretion system C-terminal sorting domain-containing protein [Chryseobacterium profundimaris]